ncbi:MAG TPA: hypothetical protein VEK08_13270 [Planctomycetota bacterium]|nr:hypothetical protein [Planctomycetota bacterium]
MDREFRVGVFDDIAKAQRAVDDALASGVSQRKIMLVMSDDQTANDQQSEPQNVESVVHPGQDTTRSQLGGATGGAVGGFLGAMSLFLGDTLDSRAVLYTGLVLALGAGAATGACVARNVPKLLRRMKDKRFTALVPQHSEYDDWRSSVGGAIGGLFGSIAGTLSSYLIGIPNAWFFITTGMWAAMASIIFGNLVGAMSGRGLSPRNVGGMENLADGERKILVSIDVSEQREKASQIEELLRRDGARFVRPA